MLRTVIPVRSRQLPDRHLARRRLASAALSDGSTQRMVSGSRWPFISAAASEQRKAIAVGEVLGGREGRELLAGALLAHPRREDRVDDDDVGGRAAELESRRRAPGSRPRRRPWPRRRRRWCWSAPAPAWRRRGRSGPCSRGDERVVEGAGRVLDGADQQLVQQVPVLERRLVQRLRRRASRRPGGRGRRPGRSARPAPRTRPRVASSSSRSTTRPSQRSSGSRDADPRPASRPARSVPATSPRPPRAAPRPAGPAHRRHRRSRSRGPRASATFCLSQMANHDALECSVRAEPVAPRTSGRPRREPSRRAGLPARATDSGFHSATARTRFHRRRRSMRLQRSPSQDFYGI